MKNNPTLMSLIAVTMFLAITDASAITITNLHNFVLSDGASPYAGLVLSSNTLFGTTFDGGSKHVGNIFRVNTDGSQFASLYSFTNNGDGANLNAGLVLLSNKLYGTASGGGANYYGSIYRINTDGSGFTNLYSFTPAGYPIATNGDGAGPYAGLVLLSNTLYGTAGYAGLNGNGSIYKININGTGFTNLHNFNYTDGAAPYAGLTLSNNVLYGTTDGGGSGGNGSIFRINADGTGFTNLYSFTATVSGTNGDGASPHGGVILSGNALFGTAALGGSMSLGTVYSIHMDGSAFTNLHSFSGILDGDGSHPSGGLLLRGNTLYGTTTGGTIFRINTDGSDYTNVYTFSAVSGSSSTNTDGTRPDGVLLASGNTLYGTAERGGTAGYGTVFALTLDSVGSIAIPIPLRVEWSGSALVFSWTNAAFDLQAAPAVTGTYTNVSGATSPYTNPITSGQQFFRLNSN